MAKKTVSANGLAHGSKSIIIRKILDSGITKPSAIMAEAKTKYNVEVYSGLINNVKQKYLAKGRGKKASGPALGMGQILSLNKQLLELGSPHVALQAIQLTGKFIA